MCLNESPGFHTLRRDNVCLLETSSYFTCVPHPTPNPSLYLENVPFPPPNTLAHLSQVPRLSAALLGA